MSDGFDALSTHISLITCLKDPNNHAAWGQFAQRQSSTVYANKAVFRSLSPAPPTMSTGSCTIFPNVTIRRHRRE